jgi:hypothetical protein
MASGGAQKPYSMLGPMKWLKLLEFSTLLSLQKSAIPSVTVQFPMMFLFSQPGKSRWDGSKNLRESLGEEGFVYDEKPKLRVAQWECSHII